MSCVVKIFSSLHKIGNILLLYLLNGILDILFLCVDSRSSHLCIILLSFHQFVYLPRNPSIVISDIFLPIHLFIPLFICFFGPLFGKVHEFIPLFKCFSVFHSIVAFIIHFLFLHSLLCFLFFLSLLVCLFVCSLIHSFVHLFICLFANSFVHMPVFVHACLHLFFHSFNGSS